MFDQNIALTPEDCHQQARVALDAAMAAPTEDVKREHLRLAAEWLKLAAEISRSPAVE
jgi:propanediol dehydratase small subunit